ncbi:MAG: glycosyltransferase, partial [Pseudonocardiaceae bacterium]
MHLHRAQTPRQYNTWEWTVVHSSYACSILISPGREAGLVQCSNSVSLRSLAVTVVAEVDCVVVSYNSAADLPACIDSLTSQEGVSVRVVVVDNLSCDDSVGTARRRGSAVIMNDLNRGFAAAVNQGLQQ